LVIASIHQPSTATFALFDRLLLLSQGSTIYNDRVGSVGLYFGSVGYEMPQYINPAEFVLELANTDFASNQELADSKLEGLVQSWEKSSQQATNKESISEIKNTPSSSVVLVEESEKRSVLQHAFVPFILVHRNFIKSYRDIIAYGIRMAMYLGLAILMGTVWLRLSPEQNNIQSFTNAIFFGGAFMSFMAVSSIHIYRFK
jgi:hypothetical protein